MSFVFFVWAFNEKYRLPGKKKNLNPTSLGHDSNLQQTSSQQLVMIFVLDNQTQLAMEFFVARFPTLFPLFFLLQFLQVSTSLRTSSTAQCNQSREGTRNPHQWLENACSDQQIDHIDWGNPLRCSPSTNNACEPSELRPDLQRKQKRFKNIAKQKYDKSID